MEKPCIKPPNVQTVYVRVKRKIGQGYTSRKEIYAHMKNSQKGEGSPEMLAINKSKKIRHRATFKIKNRLSREAGNSLHPPECHGAIHFSRSGSGRRCQESECGKLARGGSDRCAGHGGGKRKKGGYRGNPKKPKASSPLLHLVLIGIGLTLRLAPCGGGCAKIS